VPDINLTEDEAKQVAESFLKERHRKGSVAFEKVLARTVEDEECYYLEGVLSVRTGTVVAQYLWPPDKYQFKIFVHKHARRIVKWEMR